jgi:hypothetical protein
MNFTRVTSVNKTTYLLLNDAIGHWKLRWFSRPIISKDKSDVRLLNSVPFRGGWGGCGGTALPILNRNIKLINFVL